MFVYSPNGIWYLLWAGYFAGFQQQTSNQNPKIPASGNSHSGGTRFNKHAKSTRNRNYDKDVRKQGAEMANLTYLRHSFIYSGPGTGLLG